MMTQPLSSGSRKYTPILAKLISDKVARIVCSHIDTPTIMAGVKKEKHDWVLKNKWPKGWVLKIEVTDIGLIFKRVVDTSINNL